MKRIKTQPPADKGPALYVKPSPSLFFRLTLVFADPKLYSLKIRVGSTVEHTLLRARGSDHNAVRLHVNAEERQTIANLFSEYMGSCWLRDTTRPSWNFPLNAEHWISRDGAVRLTVQDGAGTLGVGLSTRQFCWKT